MDNTLVTTKILPGIRRTEVAKGTNVFDFDPDGRIARVVGFWRF